MMFHYIIIQAQVQVNAMRRGHNLGNGYHIYYHKVEHITY